MSQRILWATIAIVLALAAASTFASDRSIRCGTHLVYGGGGKNAADMYEVLKKCGEPAEKMGLSWIYIQGNSTRTLTFDYNGKLQIIETRRN